MGDGVGDAALARTGDEGLSRFPVDLENADEASGLADMLHQFLQQTVDSSAAKRRAARRLSGTLWFQSAEDMSLVVALTFAKDHIGVMDAPAHSLSPPSLTADFLSTAHITTGEESPFALLRQKKIRARVRLTQALFLMRVLNFMKIEEADASAAQGAGETPHAARSRVALWVILGLMVAVTVAVLWFVRR